MEISTENSNCINQSEQKIWNQCRKRLAELYGNSVPESFQIRLEDEIEAFSSTGIAEFTKLLGVLRREQAGSFRHVEIRSPVNSSLTAYLLGATDFNPLTPHYYCPNCKRVELRPDEEDGWDLPEKQCSCGCQMRRDGHDIPCAAVLPAVERSGLYAELRLSATEYDNVLQLIRDSFGLYHPQQVKHEDMHYSFDMRTYILLPKDSEQKMQDCISLPYEEYRELKKNIRIYPSFRIRRITGKCRLRMSLPRRKFFNARWNECGFPKIFFLQLIPEILHFLKLWGTRAMNVFVFHCFCAFSESI